MGLKTGIGAAYKPFVFGLTVILHTAILGERLSERGQWMAVSAPLMVAFARLHPQHDKPTAHAGAPYAAAAPQRAHDIGLFRA